MIFSEESKYMNMIWIAHYNLSPYLGVSEFWRPPIPKRPQNIILISFRFLSLQLRFSPKKAVVVLICLFVASEIWQLLVRVGLLPF